MGVKVILQIYPVVPAKDDAEREALRPLGRNAERYHEVVHGTSDIVKALDDLGYWGVSAIEHHFHSEGWEVGPNPGILNAYWASQVKRLRVGQLGYVMSTQNPFRVAEETAMLDHLTNGKFFVGFARGYQARWTNIVGQHFGSRATLSDGSPDDDWNRRMFEEQVDLVTKCWTEDSLNYNGEFWKVPFPYDTGVEDYPAAPSAAQFGTTGEVGERGEIRRVAVVPSPYQKPHPPVFVATTISAASSQFCGRRDFIPLYISPLDKCIEMGQVFREESSRFGRNYKPGEHTAMVRWMHITDTAEAYDAALRQYDLGISEHFYSAFRSRQPGRLKAGAVLYGSGSLDTLKDNQTGAIYFGGTVDDARREIVAEYEKYPAEYLVLITHYAQQPKEDLIRELELFATKVVTEVGGLEPPTPRSVPAAVSA
jgi:alkanesulfonate monooxygenase SsuD/methylene tetrahydromethanopterin reductase-like flavin-dependent oxidoreductase (luciferase family)